MLIENNNNEHNLFYRYTVHEHEQYHSENCNKLIIEENVIALNMDFHEML